MMFDMWLSAVFFLLYVAGAVIIGIVSSRRESEEDFMIAERRVQGVQVAATMSAGFFDGFTLALYLAFIFQYGVSALWGFIGLGLGFILLKRYAARIKQQSEELKVYTMPEYFFKVVGKRAGVMFSMFLLIQFFLLLVINLIISGKVLSAIFPISYTLALVIGGAVVLTYLLLAGFKAVVRTDVFQLFIMIVMSVMTALVLFGKAPITLAELDVGAMGIGNITGFLILGGFGIMVAPDIWQRIFATKDEKNLKRGLGYAAVILPLLALIISVIGLTTKQLFPSIAPEDALVTGFSQLLPFGIREFGMVLLYAVTLSSSDTVAFVVSSILTRDFKNYSRKYTEESMRKLTRIFTVCFVLLAAAVGILYQNIMALGFSLASLNVALFPVVFGSLHWRLKDRAVWGSLMLGLISIVFLFFAGQLNPQTAVLALPVVLASLIIFQKASKLREKRLFSYS